MKILFTTPILNHPAAGGPQLRIENSIIALSRFTELDVICRKDVEGIGGAESEKFYVDNCSNFMYSPSTTSKARRPLSLGSRIVNKISHILFKKLLIKKDLLRLDAEFIVAHARNNAIDIIWFGYGNISYPLMKLIREMLPEIKLVCDTDSVWSRFVLRELPYIKDAKRAAEVKAEGEQKEIEEKDWVKICDITTGVSEVDVEYYQSIADDKDKIRVFSNVINLDTYKNPPAPPDTFNKPCMYLAGSFWKDSPMEVAARWVIESILPLVKEAIPDIHFYIIGRGSDTILEDVNDESITITGMLDSVLPYLCNVDVSVVPLGFESGTRYKILEAAACGIPIVSTTLGAEGIPITHEKDIIIADSAEDFASAIVRLIEDKPLADVLAKNCQELVNTNYGIEVLVKEGEDIVDSLVGINNQ